MTESTGCQPPTDFVNTLPGQLQLYNSNAEHYRPRDFQKVKEGAEKERRFQNESLFWPLCAESIMKSEHLVLCELCLTEQKVLLRNNQCQFLKTNTDLNSWEKLFYSTINS